MNRPYRSVVLALVCASVGCFDVPEEDAGDAAYVAFATTTLLGRRPLSLEEVRALEEVQQQAGRDAMLQVLMAQPEFTEHWSRVLMDDLLLWRDGGEVPNDRSCFDETAVDATDYDDLVEHLRFRSWRTPFCPDGDDFGLSGLRGRTKASGPDTSTWLVDPNAPDDRDRGEITRDAEIDRWVEAGDVAALESQWAVESRTGSGETVIAATTPVLPPPGDGLMVDDDVELPVMAVAPVFDKAACDQRFTLADVLKASLSEDRMDALLRAAIAPQATYTAGTSNRRNATEFLSSYLNRDMDCVTCHSSQYSTTNPTPRNGHWDRFEPATPVALETNVFSYADPDGWHDGALGGNGAYLRVVRLYRTDQWTDDGGLHPFGMDPSCTTFGSGDDARTGFVDPQTLPALDDDAAASLAGLKGSEAGVLELMDHFALAVHELDWADLEPVPDPAYGALVDPDDLWTSTEFAQCLGCHSGGIAPLLSTNAATMTPARIHDIVANGSLTGGMQGFGVDDANAALHYFMSSGGHQMPMMYRDDKSGLAHLAAMQFVDNVFEEVTGARLTTDTGFPRNPEAAQTLNALTWTFINNGWSLQALLQEMLTNGHANRLAPQDSTLQAYPLPMLVDPFADVNEDDPTFVVQEGDDANGPGDLVHRWSVHSLMSQVQHALEWPEAPLFPDEVGNGYGDTNFLTDVGAQVSRTRLGFGDHPMKAALAWEDEIGTCANPSYDRDFIDRVTDPELDYTLEEAMLAVKERLLGSSVWWSNTTFDGDDIVGPGGPDNEMALAGDFTGYPLSAPASNDPDAVRDYCAALLNSPQFLLSGLPSEIPGDTDSLVPCVQGEACHWTDHCDDFAATAGVLGLGEVRCEDDAFTTFTWAR